MSKDTADDDLLKEARDRLQQCIDAESDNRLEALDDLRFGAGEQWPDAMKQLRVIDNRPCLTINKLPAFIHQVTNDQRQNRPSIKVHAVDDNADEETADVMQGMIRHIEYNSNADVAYDTAVNSAAAIGFGYFRLVTEYCYDDSFDQDIKFKRIRNPFTVYIDPASQEPDGSDQRYCFITEIIKKEEFDKQYPDAEIGSQTSILNGPNDVTPTWMADGGYRLAEYMRIEETEERLYRMPDGSSNWASELSDIPQAQLDSLKSRMSSKREVWWYKVTGADVLEKKKIDCYWIPVFPVYGDETEIEGKVMRSGIIRFAKDPQRMYNFMMTSATEEVALRPKTPFIGAEGQFDGYEDEWGQANNKSYAYLQYRMVTADGMQAPPPQRSPMADIPNGMLTMAMHASDNIKATTGIFDASLGAKGNETSGKAIIARQKEGDTANLHYSDNLVRTLRHAGRCIMWMIPYVYDVERVVKVMGEDGQLSHKTINQQQTKMVSTPEGFMQAVNTVLNDTTVGEYDVTVSAGPSYSTQRQETLAQLMELSQTTPKLMDIAGDKVIESMDMHGGEEIAERWKRTIPPAILGPQDGDADPEEQLEKVTAENGQLKQQVEQMSHVLDAAHQEIQQLDAKAQVTLQQTQMQEAGATQREQMKLDAQTQHLGMKEQGTTDRDLLKHQTSTAHVDLKESNQNAREAAKSDADSYSNDVAIAVAKIGAESREQVAALTGLVQLLIAQMQPPPVVADEAANVTE